MKICCITFKPITLARNSHECTRTWCLKNGLRAGLIGVWKQASFKSRQISDCREQNQQFNVHFKGYRNDVTWQQQSHFLLPFFSTCLKDFFPTCFWKQIFNAFSLPSVTAPDWIQCLPPPLWVLGEHAVKPCTFGKANFKQPTTKDTFLAHYVLPQ